VVAVIVPAHNEAAVISRLLARLAPAAGHEQVLGWTSSSWPTLHGRHCAGRRGVRAAVRVLSIPEPSKRAALLAGDAAATSYSPDLYRR